MHHSPSLNFSLNEDQQAIADALERFCQSRCDDAVIKGLTDSFSIPLWRELAEMGVLSAATPEGDGGALEICAISEALGRAVFPGPLAASFLATQILEKEQRIAVAEGHSIVSLGYMSANQQQTLMPFAPQANIFLLTDGVDIYHTETASAITPIKTLGGEPWGRVDMKATRKYANADRALVLCNISLAAYLTAAAKRLVKEASEYANLRKQFGKALGDFQAVAHPLADCAISLTAAETLARAAASCFDNGAAENILKQSQQYASGARISANRAALKTAYVCHQVYAGIGITLEGPAFHISRRIRQLVSQAPGDSAAKENVLLQIGLGTSS